MKIRLYGHLKEKHHMDEIHIQNNDGMDIKSLAARLRDEHGIDVDLIRFAVNNQFVPGSFQLNGESVVDLIPPVSGG